MGFKKFVPSLESLSSLGFVGRNLGCPGNFAGISRTPGGACEVCAKKSVCSFSAPNLGGCGPKLSDDQSGGQKGPSKQGLQPK